MQGKYLTETNISISNKKKSKFFIPEFKRWFSHQIIGEKTSKREN